MLYTLDAVKDNIRNRDGSRVFYLGKNDQLTASARDYLTAQHIRILPAQEAAVEEYRLLGGGFVREKPEHMTHLRGDILVHKTHPRIAFRGAMDTLQAELLLCQQEASQSLKKDLGEVLAFSRKILSSEVMEEQLALYTLCGLTAQELRSHSHRPQEYYGQPHFMPTAADSRMILLLNRARCAARAAELKAVAAFMDAEGNPDRTDIIECLNRLSSMLYILMIREKAAIK